MSRKAKHRQIFDALHAMIDSGVFKVGQKLPSEAELAIQYQVSRPTVARAMKDLEERGHVDRQVGSGTYVRAHAKSKEMHFGLIIPAIRETEIFVPISRHIARELSRYQHSLAWGESFSKDSARKIEEAKQLCRKYIRDHYAGVFFAPLELTEAQEVVNRDIVKQLKQADIPVVLLDRDITGHQERSHNDLVSIDHRRAAFVLARHLLSLGLERIDFLAPPLSAPSVNLRIAGYQDALWQAEIAPDQTWIHWGEPTDSDFVGRVVQQPGARTFICANDFAAREFTESLKSLGYKVPDDVRVAGFDDVNEDEKILTTMHQPCEALGLLAAHAMLERINHPDLPPREILVYAELVVRSSSGPKRSIG